MKEYEPTQVELEQERVVQPVTAENYTNVSRRSLDIEDYVDIVRRHKGWILGPAFAGTVIAVVAAFLWPEIFVSTAVIRVVPSLVPQNYVATNVNSAMSQRINSMYQTITNRINLANMINEMNLYPKDRQQKPIDDVVEQMRSAIRLGDVMPLGGPRENGMSAFSISFTYGNRYTAQKVTKALTTRFLTENQRERTFQSNQTTQFLRDQFESAKKNLETIEDKLTKFRTVFAGRLPEQAQMNQAQLGMLEQRIGNLNSQISRAAQEKMLLESDLRAYKAQRTSLNPPPPEQVAQMQKSDELSLVERRIQQLQIEIESLRQNYTDSYPDVRRRQAELNAQIRLREKLQAMELQAAAEAAVHPVKSPRRYEPGVEREKINLDSAIDKVQNMLKNKETEIEQYTKGIADAEQQVKVVQSRLQSFPVTEQQYSEVIRDYGVAKAKYDDMNTKMSTSSVAEELEKRNQGETLELLDDASLPTTPTQPKRPMMIGMGAALGLVLGCILAGVREAKDTCLKNLKDVRAYTQLVILGSIPLLENDLVVRRRKRFAWLAWSTASLVGIAVMTGSVLYYYTTKA